MSTNNTVTAKMRYVIMHHPGLFTEIMLEQENGQRKRIEDRFTWAVAREYCRDGCKSRGVEPHIERPEPYVETFPWIEVELDKTQQEHFGVTV